MKTVCRQELRELVDSRLKMQSTVRSLGFYGLAGLNSYELLHSPKFHEILARWPIMQQELIFKLLGGIYWRQLQNEISN